MTASAAKAKTTAEMDKGLMILRELAAGTKASKVRAVLAKKGIDVSDSLIYKVHGDVTRHFRAHHLQPAGAKTLKSAQDLAALKYLVERYGSATLRRFISEIFFA